MIGRIHVALVILLLISFPLIFFRNFSAKTLNYCPPGKALNLIAHEDDDLLFMNPDVYRDIQSGKCSLTVFATSGDGGEDYVYWYGRELGSRSAYAYMAQFPNIWIYYNTPILDRKIATYYLAGRPEVRLMFLRLPDGNLTGHGFASTNSESLQKLWTGKINEIHTIDRKYAYTKKDLVNFFSRLLNNYSPGQVRTGNYKGIYDDRDHSDHITLGYFVKEANNYYSVPHVLTGYLGYDTAGLIENLQEKDKKLKEKIFFNYAKFDRFVCGVESGCEPPKADFKKWFSREYASVETVTRPVNFPSKIQQVEITFSSESRSDSQFASAVIDGIVDGFPKDDTKEWSTEYQGKYGWINLDWKSEQIIKTITFFDRPNIDDNVTGGTVIFDNWQSFNIGELDNSGKPKVINVLPTKSTSVRINIRGSKFTSNIGLSEIKIEFAQP